MITPNLFELCWLANVTEAADMASVNNADLVRLARDLPGAGTHERVTLVTSVPCDDGARLGNLLITPADVWMTSVMKQPDVPKGSGDFFAAMFAGDWLRHQDMKQALARATAASDVLITQGVADLQAARQQGRLVDDFADDDEDDDALPPTLPLIRTQKRWFAATDWPVQAPEFSVCVSST